MVVDRWSYCHYCGGPLADFADGEHLQQICTACQRVIYRNPVPAAGGVVERDGQLLLARRKHAPWQDHWYFPSGFVEYDEDVEVTATREVREETGLDVAIAGVFGVYSYFDDPRKNGIIILFRATIVGGTLKAGDDAAEVAFFPADLLPSPIGFASHRRALAEWVERRGAETRRR
ncbi:MAG TPA: NUDIX hydrolase [Chloroflexota bacterium]|nr:NUDIX hydrolase [Chloroflexota bacterium]